MVASAAAGVGPPARTVLDALTGEPGRLFVAGGIGTGKSTALERVRQQLREQGCAVTSRVPDPADTESAVVIDDVHLLDDAGLRALTELADRSERTIVVASEPRDHRPGLRALAAALEREHPRITLGSLPNGALAHALTDPSGHPPSAELLSGVAAATAGIPFLVAAVGGASGQLTDTGAARAAELALIERLRRLEQSDLEALVIASLSTDLGAADLAAALEVSAQDGVDLIDRARGTGLLQPSHPAAFHRAVHRAGAHLVGAARHHELEMSLLRTQVDSSTLSSNLALELAEHGVRDDSLAQLLRAHAATDTSSPAQNVRIHRAAVAAGADLKAALADALALAADTPAAAVMADELLSSTDAADRAAGVRIAAGVAAHNGNYPHAAELFDWLGPHPDATVGSAAALVRVATGDLAAARAALETARSGPPTAPARAARSLAEGIVLSVDGPYPAAAARLGQALAVDRPVMVTMPDSAAALVTLAALHGGDPVRARSVAERAVRDDLDGNGLPLFATRHRLLRGWSRMQAGQLAGAAADADTSGADTSGADTSGELRGRDALWAAALRAGIARRGGDAGALATHWATGVEVLAEYSIDLFALLPLGELWMAGARLRQQDRIVANIENGFGVLASLGNPVSWALPLHWAGVHAGILAADPAGVAPHGQALTAMADQSPFAAALAAAGRTWLRVLANQVDADEVIAAARGLAQFGLTSDATRLAAQAALQAADPKVSGQMLQVARDLKLSAGADSEASPVSTARQGGQRLVSTALSDREREVAELLLLGMPYRDIGAQLFISAKTVEHHVARIRRRLGAQSRPEMLSMLRALLASDT